MFSLKGNTVSFAGKLELSPKQVIRLNRLEKDKQLDYIYSIMGKKTKIKHNKIQDTSLDQLAIKKKNSVLNRLNSMLYNHGGANHRPFVRTKTSQWVGVEIECHIDGAGDGHCSYCDGEGSEPCSTCDGYGDNGNSYEDSCSDCYGDGRIECGYCDGGNNSSVREDLMDAISRAKITNVSVRDDGSLDSDTGVEICFLFDASKGYKKLEKLCRILNDFDAKIDRECGLHVHLDYHGLNPKELPKVGNHFAKFLPMLTKFVPVSRRDNDYCLPIVSDTKRYSAINLTAFNRHETIEVRLHGGSTNFEKIKNWIELLVRIKKRYNRGSVVPKIKNYQDFMDVLRLPDSLAGYYDKRLQKFNREYCRDLNDFTDSVEEEAGEEYAA